MAESIVSLSPALSAIVVIPDTYQTVARTVAALQKQTAASRLEIVFIVPARSGVTIPSELAASVHSVQVVEIPDLLLSPARAEGVRRAKAPVVAFTEDHAFPDPNWAECLIAAHEKPVAAVGPAMRNATPASLVSEADFYTGYGKWAEPIESGRVDFLMEHNCSYKRDLLLEYGARLPTWLESETTMQFDLAKRGHTFWLEGMTRTVHLCFGQWRPWLSATVWHGRVFAAHRSKTWSAGKRTVYSLTAPLIPFVRLVRIRRCVKRASLSTSASLKLLALIFIGLVVEAAGQGLGYAFGSGKWADASIEYEFHRERYLGTTPSANAK